MRVQALMVPAWEAKVSLGLTEELKEKDKVMVTNQI